MTQPPNNIKVIIYLDYECMSLKRVQLPALDDSILLYIYMLLTLYKEIV